MNKLNSTHGESLIASNIIIISSNLDAILLFLTPSGLTSAVVALTEFPDACSSKTGENHD
ncbi:hypothetical protein ABEI22_00900 [Erwinia billingiae]|jgi:hypothetical protein|uniref:hypothetical protein n=1 Tax=Erwinia billingiae TaxID=182337 RepID=UPI00320B88AF